MADSPATGNVDRSLSQSVVDSSTTEADTSKTEDKTTIATSANTTTTSGESNKTVEDNKDGVDSDAKENGGEAKINATVGGLAEEGLAVDMLGGGQGLIWKSQEELKEGANTSGNESDVRSRSASPTKLERKTAVKKHSFKPVSVNKLFMKEVVAPSSSQGAGGSTSSATTSLSSSSMLSKGRIINHLLLSLLSVHARGVR